MKTLNQAPASKRDSDAFKLSNQSSLSERDLAANVPKIGQQHPADLCGARVSWGLWSAALTLCAIVLVCFLAIGSAIAENLELFSRAPEPQLDKATPAQIEHLKYLRQTPTTGNLELINIDPRALQGNAVKLSLSRSQTRTLLRKSQEVLSQSDFIWHGAFADAHGTATLTVHNGSVTGLIFDGPDVYRVEPVAGSVHALIKIDRSKLPPPDPPNPPGAENKRQGKHTSSSKSPKVRSSNRNEPIVVDVLVVYTPSALIAANYSIDPWINTWIWNANEWFQNSLVNIKLQVVDRIELSGYDEGDKGTDDILADFAGNDFVNKKRDEAGADIAVLIEKNKKDWCGRAYQGPVSASKAFAIVHYECMAGTSGALSHEIGHLFGAAHEPGNGLASFSYGHGYQHLDPTLGFFTIMAYPCIAGFPSPVHDFCPNPIGYFSNPDVKWNGMAVGDAATYNNARVLNQNAAKIAALRHRPAKLTGRVTDAVSGEPVVDAYVIIRGTQPNSAITDDAGSYTLDGIKPSIYDLAITATGYQEYREGLSFSDGQSVARNVALARGPDLGDVKGTVEDSRGIPVVHAVVAVGGTEIRGETDGAGHYRLYNVPQALQSFDAYKAEMGPDVKSATVIARKAITLDFELSDAVCPHGEQMCDDGFCRPACPICRPPQQLCEDGKCRKDCP